MPLMFQEKMRMVFGLGGGEVLGSWCGFWARVGAMLDVLRRFGGGGLMFRFIVLIVWFMAMCVWVLEGAITMTSCYIPSMKLCFQEPDSSIFFQTIIQLCNLHVSIHHCSGWT